LNYVIYNVIVEGPVLYNIVRKDLILHSSATNEFLYQIYKSPHHFTWFTGWHVALFYKNDLIYTKFDFHVGYMVLFHLQWCWRRRLNLLMISKISRVIYVGRIEDDAYKFLTSAKDQFFFCLECRCAQTSTLLPPLQNKMWVL